VSRKVRARILPARPDGLLLGYQARWVADTARLKLMEKSRQIGISWGTAYATVERTARRDARHDQWVSSRDEMQAKLFLEDCKKWAAALAMAADDLGEVVLDPTSKLSAYVLRFANGHSIYSMSSNPDAQAGKRGGRVLDEFALHPDPRKLWDIAYPGITWGGSLEVISTHRGANNFFAQMIAEAREGGNPKAISLHRVTLSDALEDGFLWKLQQMLPDSAPQQDMDEGEYFTWVRSGASSEEAFQQEYMCQPADDASSWLPYELISGCEDPSLSPSPSPQGGGGYQGNPCYVGMDFAARGDLTVIAVLEDLGNVLYTRELLELKATSFAEQLAHLDRILREYRVTRAALDQTGLGEMPVQEAQRRHGSYRVEGVIFTAARKLDMATALKQRLEDRAIRLPASPVLREDLHSVKREAGATGAPRLSAERTAHGHADRFWALALACAAAAGGRPDYSAIQMAGETTRWPT
jgi:phage FluMu gp28-like protein